MRSLSLMVLGWMLIILDVHVGTFDVLPDVVGWAVLLSGLGRVLTMHQGFAVAAGGAVGGLLSALALPVWPESALVTVVETIATTVAVFGTCTALIGLHPEERVRRQANLIRWLDLGLGVLALAVAVAAWDRGGAEVSGGAAMFVVVLAASAIGVFLWFLLLLWAQRDRPELRPDQPAASGS